MNIHLGQTGAAAVNLLMQSPVVVPGELLKQMSLYRLSSLTMNKPHAHAHDSYSNYAMERK